MKPIESAEEFAKSIARQALHECECLGCMGPLIEARDNTVRLALLDEIREFTAAEPGVLWILEKLRAEHGL